MSLFGEIKSDTAIIRDVIITGDNFRKGSTAPTDVTIGTTPTIPALNFSSINELVSFSEIMPSDWDKSKDVKLELLFSLSAVETNNDTLDVTIDYVAISKETTGSGYSKTSTQKTGQVTVTTANGLAVDDVYTMTIVLPAADANNGFALSDKTVGFGIELHLTNTTGVAEANLSNGKLIYESLY